MSTAKLFAIFFFSASLFASCSGASGSHAGTDSLSETGAGTSSDSVYDGKSSLSYTIGNRHVAIKDYLKKGNQNFIALFRNDVKNDAAGGIARINITNSLTSEVFDFSVAGKGVTTIVHYTPSLTEGKTKASYMSPKFKNYYADSVVITITESSASHIAGTFSGKFIDRDNKLEAQVITDGKFDLEYTKDEK